MSRLAEIFAARKREGRGVLVAYLTVGDPSLAVTHQAVDAAVAAGADIVELGVPFSDPVADGPTIQAASQRALERGVTLADVFAAATAVRQRHPMLGLVLMGYANPFFCWGAERAVAASRTAGVDGWIVPDVPTEEANLFTRHLTPAGVAWIPLVAPTTDVHRAQMIVATLRPPFVYYVSVTGVTGARSEFPAAWAAPLDAMRAQCAAPFVVGFGISSVALAREAAAHSDGVVVGSALIDRLASDGTDGPARVAEFLAELRAVV